MIARENRTRTNFEADLVIGQYEWLDTQVSLLL